MAASAFRGSIWSARRNNSCAVEVRPSLPCARPALIRANVESGSNRQRLFEIAKGRSVIFDGLLQAAQVDPCVGGTGVQPNGALQILAGLAMAARFQMDVSDRQHGLCILRGDANYLFQIDQRLLRIARPIKSRPKPKIVAPWRGVILAGEWERMPKTIAVLAEPAGPP